MLGIFVALLLVLVQSYSSGPSQTAINNFIKTIDGEVVTKDNPSYLNDSQQFLAMHDDLRPFLIVYCENKHDVLNSIKFAKRWQIQFSTRSGGHSYGGYSVCQNCIVIDVSRINHLNYDQRNKVVNAGPGIRVDAFPDLLKPYNIIVPHGACPSVHLSGLTLGGGFGFTHRLHGMLADNVVEFEIVTAKPEVIKANSQTNSDLYWALRGSGGGNFGIVTNFVYRTHKVPSRVIGGSVAWPLSDTAQVAALYQEITFDTPNMAAFGFYLQFVVDSTGSPIPTISGLWAGDITQGWQILNRFLAIGSATSNLQESSYYDAVDALFVSLGAVTHPNWVSHSAFFPPGANISGPGALADIIEQNMASAPPGLGYFWLVEPLGYAIRNYPVDTAFPFRQAQFNFLLCTLWLTPELQQPAEDLNQKVWLEVFPLTLKTSADSTVQASYVNYLNTWDTKWEASHHDYNYGRLQQIKLKYDPTNLFNHPQSINLPASAWKKK